MLIKPTYLKIQVKFMFKIFIKINKLIQFKLKIKEPKNLPLRIYQVKTMRFITMIKILL